MTMKFWDDEKSITLTRCVVVAALIGSIAMTLGGPWVTAWFIAVAGLRPGTGLTATLLVLGYACAALAIGMLVSLYKFLRRIEKGEVFVPENVAALRRGGGALPGSGFHLLPALCGAGRGRWIYGAAGAGAEKRLCSGRAHEKRTGLYNLRGTHHAHCRKPGCDDGPPSQRRGGVGRGNRHHPGESVHPEKQQSQSRAVLHAGSPV